MQLGIFYLTENLFAATIFLRSYFSTVRNTCFSRLLNVSKVSVFLEEEKCEFTQNVENDNPCSESEVRQKDTFTDFVSIFENLDIRGIVNDDDIKMICKTFIASESDNLRKRRIIQSETQ